jgi:hypothetical protein
MLDKLYKIAVVFLLVLILAAQAYPLIVKPQPSDACTDALSRAAIATSTTRKYLDEALDDYDAAAYSRAENINQQIFMAGEQSVMLQHANTLLVESLLEVQAECR